MKNFVLFLFLSLFLSSCVDWSNDERGFAFNQWEFENKEDSLNKLYDREEIGLYYEKYKFQELQSTDTLSEMIKEKYVLWENWSSALQAYLLKKHDALELDSAYFLWYLSICIGLLTLRLISIRKKVNKKGLKYVFFTGITFLFWLGTSCYAYLFVKYKGYFAEPEVTFLTISTQFKLFPFMIVWLANSIYIGLIAICLHRFFVHLFALIAYELNHPFYYMGGKALPSFDFFKKKFNIIKSKDDRIKNLLIYGTCSFSLLYLYYQNVLFSKLEGYRTLLAFADFSQYWFLLIVIIGFIIYYSAEGIQKNLLDEIANDNTNE